MLAKSFARIHETNLKKQGILAVTFDNPGDYEKIREDDLISLRGVDSFMPGKNLDALITHSDGSEENIQLSHTYNQEQIAWFKAGSALNVLRSGNSQD